MANHRKNILRDANCETSAIETYGEVFPNLLIEAVDDPGHPGQLRLQSWDGRRSRIAARICYRGRTYVPRPIDAGLAQAVRFPLRSRSFGSVKGLVSSMREVFSRYANVSAEVTSILAAFSIASCVVDCLPLAPTLYLIGSENQCRLVLRLLACTGSRPALLGEVDMAALATLPPQLRATLLVSQRDLSRAVTRALRVSQNRHFRVALGRRTLDLYGAKAVSADAGSMGGPGIEVYISPSPQSGPLLTEAVEHEIAAEVQPKLLYYRMLYHRRVRDAKVDCGKFFPIPPEEVHAWLAPLVNCLDLREMVSNYLLELSQEAAGYRFSDLKTVVAEGALSFCHEPDQREFFIGELAKRVNALLKGRHEETQLSDRKVGSVLRDLGIRAERVTAGCKVVLADAVRERIHAIAQSYRVLSLQDGVVRCRQCPGKLE